MIIHIDPRGHEAKTLVDKIERGRLFFETNRSWLGSFMRTFKTWPEPILILDTRCGGVQWPEAGGSPRGLFLVDGQKRLDGAAYLHSKGLLRKPLLAWELSYPASN